MLNLYFVSRVMHVTVKTPLAGQSDTISYVTHITDLRELLSRILWNPKISIPNVTDWSLEMTQMSRIDPKCHILNQIYTSNIETRDFCRSMSIGTDVTLSTMSRPAKCPQCHNLAISLTQISTMLTFGWERFDRKVKGNIFKLSGVKSIPHTFVSSWSFGKNLPRYLYTHKHTQINTRLTTNSSHFFSMFSQ